MKYFSKFRNFSKFFGKIGKLHCDWEILPSQKNVHIENFVSKKCSGCFWLEMLPFLGSVTNFFSGDFFITGFPNIFFSKNHEFFFGWKCYHYVTTWKSEKWAFLKVRETVDNKCQSQNSSLKNWFVSIVLTTGFSEKCRKTNYFRFFEFPISNFRKSPKKEYSFQKVKKTLVSIMLTTEKFAVLFCDWKFRNLLSTYLSFFQISSKKGSGIRKMKKGQVRG